MFAKINFKSKWVDDRAVDGVGLENQKVVKYFMGSNPFLPLNAWCVLVLACEVYVNCTCSWT